MVKQTTETSGFELKPTGHYILEVLSLKKKIIESKKTGNPFTCYEAKFEIRQSTADVEDNQLKLLYFKSQMGDLLKALGAVEVSPNKFEWDDEEVQGKLIECELVHNPDNGGTLRELLIEIKPYKDDVKKNKKEKKDVAWDD